MAMPARRRIPTARLSSLLLVGGLLAACSTGSSGAASPAPTPTPVSTPVANPVGSPEDAADRVIASDPRFAGATMLQAGSIGLSKWWEWRALDSGGYEIRITLGAGDCEAGCIHRHTWTYDVAEDGTITPQGDSGDPMPLPT